MIPISSTRPDGHRALARELDGAEEVADRHRALEPREVHGAEPEVVADVVRGADDRRAHDRDVVERGEDEEDRARQTHTEGDRTRHLARASADRGRSLGTYP